MGSSFGCRPCGPGISSIAAAYAVLATVSRSYPPPKGRFPCITHPCATKVLLPPFDLHVLGTPPAFVLSQDQTLSSNLLTDKYFYPSAFFTILTVLFTEPDFFPFSLARKSTKNHGTALCFCFLLLSNNLTSIIGLLSSFELFFPAGE